MLRPAHDPGRWRGDAEALKAPAPLDFGLGLTTSTVGAAEFLGLSELAVQASNHRHAFRDLGAAAEAGTHVGGPQVQAAGDTGMGRRRHGCRSRDIRPKAIARDAEVRVERRFAGAFGSVPMGCLYTVVKLAIRVLLAVLALVAFSFALFFATRYSKASVGTTSENLQLEQSTRQSSWAHFSGSSRAPMKSPNRAWRSLPSHAGFPVQ